MEPTIPDDDRRPAAIAPIDRQSLNLPNLITISRLFLAVIVFALIDYQGYWLTAAGLFVFAASTDALDGYIARKYGLVTTLGRILDPFADKIIVCGAFVFLLGMNENYDSGVNGWMVVIVIAREMFVSSLRGLLEEQGRDFSADWTGKIKMVMQTVAVTASLLSLSPHLKDISGFLMLRDVLLWTAVALTAYSGAAYLGRMIQMLKSDTT